MGKRKALFPGSFDPFTNGHLNTVTRASQLFDEVVVGISTNTSKQSLFTPEEKIRLTEEAVAHLSNVSVVSHPEGLTVDMAHTIGASFLIRGIRNSMDYEYEKNIAFMNRKMAGDIETILLLADDEYSSISSTMIKEIAKFQGDVSLFVPEGVAQALAEKFNR